MAAITHVIDPLSLVRGTKSTNGGSEKVGSHGHKSGLDVKKPTRIVADLIQRVHSPFQRITSPVHRISSPVRGVSGPKPKVTGTYYGSTRLPEGTVPSITPREKDSEVLSRSCRWKHEDHKHRMMLDWLDRV
jgi:hypothetical protein